MFITYATLPALFWDQHRSNKVGSLCGFFYLCRCLLSCLKKESGQGALPAKETGFLPFFLNICCKKVSIVFVVSIVSVVLMVSFVGLVPVVLTLLWPARCRQDLPVFQKRLHFQCPNRQNLFLPLQLTSSGLPSIPFLF